MNELHLFAGAGGGILGGMLLGHTTVCAVEINEYCRKVLLQRQQDGILPQFPIYDDVRTFEGTSWRGAVDIVCGGFPCQDIAANGSGKGLQGERSGLWSEMFRIVCEVQPRFVFIENSPLLAKNGLDRVLADLASVGFNAEWGVISAGNTGAHHKRERLWIVADSNNSEWGRELWRNRREEVGLETWDASAAFNQPEPVRMVDGVAYRMERLRACGNGQVPAVAALAWTILGGHQ